MSAKQRFVMDRRAFLKVLGTAGVSAAFVSALGGAQQAQAQAPVVEQVASVTGVKFGKSVPLATEGPGQNLKWQPGDTVKFLPPEKFADTPAAANFAKLPKDKLLGFYTTMVAERVWEDTGKDLFLGGKDKLYGYFHMYIGEEAIAAGAMGALNKDDFITSTHRGHGHIIAKGGDLNRMSAEIFAKQEGYCKGYGLSMHIVDMSLGIMGSNGIVGGGWWLAAGAAYSAKVRGTKQVAICFAGDQAASSRYFFNSIRNAQNFGWPYIAFIENNFQGTSTGTGFVTATKYQSELPKGIGVPVFLVDGNDVSQVYDATKQAVEYARANSAPAVIEAMTWRWYDHQGFAGAKAGQQGSFGLPYRTDDEVRQWMSRDPIVRYKAFLLDKQLATAEELAAIDKDVRAKVDASWEFARKGKVATPEMGLQNVYATGSVEATQFFDRKGTSTAWRTPDYVRQLAKNYVVEA
ncbi:MAG: thiamine pyrophosphate-dependent dehydrogenase E1 component subunit alpha [Chloroflexi bacterium]|nr:thiamine pyrophosphate-dependent dehydrogenase E1 component subunit alpha [Chloroflexota bacterium]